jgi:hypothetical protein
LHIFDGEYREVVPEDMVPAHWQVCVPPFLAWPLGSLVHFRSSACFPSIVFKIGMGPKDGVHKSR